MSYKLNVKAFFFNAKTDYLPYYKNFSLILENDAIAKDILIAVQAQNENFAYPELNLVFKINDLIVEEDIPLSSIVEKLGTTLIVDPVNSYRSNNGLIINDDDFMKSYALLAPYATASDEKYYKTLYALHYASETEKFERDYIGDAILVLAHKMISEGNAHKKEILSAITSVHSGLLDCEYENNLFNPQHHTAAIHALKEMVKNDTNSEERSLLERIKEKFGEKNKTNTSSKKETKRDIQTIDNLEEKQVAYYAGNNDNREIHTLIKESGLTSVTFSRAHKLSGLTLLKDNKTLALKKAGTTLLDAFDASVEVLIIEDTKTYEMMHTHFSRIESIIGRKMLGLELIPAEDFISHLLVVDA